MTCRASDKIPAFYFTIGHDSCLFKAALHFEKSDQSDFLSPPLEYRLLENSGLEKRKNVEMNKE